MLIIANQTALARDNTALIILSHPSSSSSPPHNTPPGKNCRTPRQSNPPALTLTPHSSDLSATCNKSPDPPLPGTQRTYKYIRHRCIHESLMAARVGWASTDSALFCALLLDGDGGRGIVSHVTIRREDAEAETHFVCLSLLGPSSALSRGCRGSSRVRVSELVFTYLTRYTPSFIHPYVFSEGEFSTYTCGCAAVGWLQLTGIHSTGTETLRIAEGGIENCCILAHHLPRPRIQGQRIGE
ncbi:unnamed protein product [Diplocarpon coronariae]